MALWQWDDSESLQPIAQTPSVRGQVVDGEPVRAEAWTTVLHPDGTSFAAAGEGALVVLYSAAPVWTGARAPSRGRPGAWCIRLDARICA